MKPTEFSTMLPDMLPRLRSFALRLSGNRHDADELVQRACIRALERVHQLRSDTAPVSWVFSIVHSIWLNELRRRNRRDRLLLECSDALLETVADPRAASETAVAVRQIVDAVERLPEPQRIALLLVSVDGLSYREAAYTLDIPIGTVMSRISRARKAIRIALGGGAARTSRDNFTGSAAGG
ncbi:MULTISPECIES: RNA polymerase sigma factor [Burkholderia]|uniref:RNA polymerase sigma factor n=1 Tax=Burkholderia TaxID=32008 RepID=UPI000678F8B1|nr:MULTISPECIES: RNA polymerase sigma factor [Burkholderia]KWU24043.1 RNA polymerase subunit sigma-70 [Burkholderia cenocepacia]OXI71089.1 RNA polymerase sigma factor [Burkholderia sp. AU31280]QRR15346.1 sigma-70 family RNA polymerase sigma factor [Burkholderia sp. MS389]QVN10907.1 RNA polymerase sigma factor [Burkholderia sp. LAS2]RQU49553.1 RNA polymerase sigma factor [Burkholderia cenocepacia]